HEEWPPQEMGEPRSATSLARRGRAAARLRESNACNNCGQYECHCPEHNIGLNHAKRFALQICRILMRGFERADLSWSKLHAGKDESRADGHAADGSDGIKRLGKIESLL